VSEKARGGRGGGYRWVVLLLFMLVVLVNQAGWITFASITVEASAFYGVSGLAIGLLSLSFMALYILLFVPAAWAIDARGFRAAVSLGALLTALGALGRGFFASSFTAVLVFQLLIAVGQPFVLGAVTSVAARWFRPEEQATASGLGSLAIYLGILGGVALTPPLLARAGMRGMLLAWGFLSAAACLLFLVGARERPGSGGARAAERLPARASRPGLFIGMRSTMGQRTFVLLLVIFFVGLGIFNGVTTWIEQIVEPRGFSAAQAGMVGAAMIVGGIVGAVAVPLLSDAVRRRKAFVIAALVGMTPSLLGVALAHTWWLLLASAALFGFFLLSAGPIGFQYGAEVTRPVPEGTSNTLLILMGQVSGIIFIFGMEGLKAADGSMTVPLVALVALLAACVVLSFFLEESPIARTEKKS
jgi:MFS family permease